MRRYSLKRQPDDAGFSLLEILVVMVIISIVMGALTFSLSDSSGRRLRLEAERLRDALQLAANDAVFEGAQTQMMLGEHSYHFTYYDSQRKQWQPYSSKAMREYHLSEDITLSVIPVGNAMNAPATTRKAQPRPAVMFFSSGEMTPFDLTLSASHHTVHIMSDGVAPIVIKEAP